MIISVDEMEIGMEHIYIAIDLKTFYASVECVTRKLDPLDTNLVVADASRTEKTICLAVSPALKQYGISGRARLFEVVSKVRQINAQRRSQLYNHRLEGSSVSASQLAANPQLELSYIVATPQMALYMDYSTRIYNIYLKYVAPEDIHVYSIDEVFIDVGAYLKTYNMTAHELAIKMIKDVLDTTGITATAGIGTNLYLCKIAMDIVAKHMPADKDGVRIAELNERSYRELLWSHKPITDFWRVGPGYAKKLYEYGLYTMGDIARCSLGTDDTFYNQELLYKLFGVNAELLIDHAWGYEPCTIADIKAYRPEKNSCGLGQVLHCAYDFEKTRIVVSEMVDLLMLDLIDKGLVTDQIVLTVGYDIENVSGRQNNDGGTYKGEIVQDRYGRRIPKHAHGTANLGRYTSSVRVATNAVLKLFDNIVDKRLMSRRLNVTANHVIREEEADCKEEYRQLELFTDIIVDEKTKALNDELDKEKKLLKSMLDIKKKYGKNAVVRGLNLKEGATAMDRNRQIGGHKA